MTSCYYAVIVSRHITAKGYFHRKTGESILKKAQILKCGAFKRCSIPWASATAANEVPGWRAKPITTVSQGLSNFPKRLRPPCASVGRSRSAGV